MLAPIAFAVPVEHVLEWCIDNFERFTNWVPVEEYAGPGFADGHWKIDRERLFGALVSAEYQLARNWDAERFPTLDAWLRAEAAGEVAYCGDAGGMDLLIPEVMDRLNAEWRARNPETT